MPGRMICVMPGLMIRVMPGLMIRVIYLTISVCVFGFIFQISSA
jgi:hypothetical protein